MGGALSFAVVVPFFNERANCLAVCAELRETLHEYSAAELVLVDDGSTDGTGDLLDRVAMSWPECRVLHLPENQGQSAALLAGFEQTTAPVIVTMDGDGQNAPRDIPRLLTRVKEADMVVGFRSCRHDSWARRMISRLANLVRSRWLGDGVSDAGCALKAFRREVVTAFIPIRTLYSFMPSLAAAAGFRVIEEPVVHRARQHGHSRYSLGSFLFLPIIDFIGLLWFRSRRCRQWDSGEDAALEEKLAAGLMSRRALRTSVAIVSLGGVVVLAFLLLTLRHPISTGPESRRVGLMRAEHIALHCEPKGQLTTEELRDRNGRWVWEIDVEAPRTNNISEIDIDAVTGKVVAMRRESASEEREEVAAEDLVNRYKGRPAP